jgi:hypothetical protein
VEVRYLGVDTCHTSRPEIARKAAWAAYLGSYWSLSKSLSSTFLPWIKSNNHQKEKRPSIDKNILLSLRGMNS